MRRQKGSVFVMTLVVLAGLVAIVAAVASTQHTVRMAQINRMERQKARAAAMNGIQRAVTTLALIGQTSSTSTSSSSSSASTTNATTLQDDWAVLGQTGDENFVVGNTSFRLQVVDSSSWININTATEDQLNHLPFAPEEVAAIMDFRSTSTTPSPLGGKDEYYNNLAEPYNAKLANFETVDELLNVKGLTAQMIYQPRTDVQSSYPAPEDAAGNQLALSDILTAYSYTPMTDPQGQARINVNQAAANAQRIAALGFTPQVLAQLIPQQGTPPPNFANLGAVCLIATSANDLQLILDNLTTDGASRKMGRININTASQSVLETIPGFTTDIAANIVSHQSQGFTSVGEIATIPGVTNQVLSQAADFITASSQTFVVRVLGKSGQTTVALEATIDVQNGQPKVILIQQPPYDDYISRWGWQDQTTTDTVLKEAQ